MFRKLSPLLVLALLSCINLNATQAATAQEQSQQQSQQEEQYPPPQSQGKNINLPFVSIHIGHGLSINAPFAHIDKMPGMPATVNAPYTNVQSSLGSYGTHVQAPFTRMDMPGYRGEAASVQAPFTNVSSARPAAEGRYPASYSGYSQAQRPEDTRR